MKKIIVLALFVLLAANIYAADITVGPKAGVGMSWLSGSDWDDMVDAYDGDSKAQMAFSIGAFCNFAMSEEFSIQPEMNLLFAKAKLEGEYMTYDAEMTTSFTALEIPVLFKYNFSGFSIFAGPDIFFIMGDMKAEVEVDGTSSDEDAEPDSRLDFGLILGGEYKLPMGEGALDIGFNYAKSLTGIGSDDSVDINIIRATVGYGFSM